MCLKYKYYVFTINTCCSQAVPDRGVVTELCRLSHTHISTHNHPPRTHTAKAFGPVTGNLISNKHPANMNSLREREAGKRDGEEFCSSASQPSAAAAAAAAGFPVFFCLIWSQEWWSNRERGWRCGLLFLAEERGVGLCAVLEPLEPVVISSVTSFLWSEGRQRGRAWGAVCVCVCTGLQWN